MIAHGQPAIWANVSSGMCHRLLFQVQRRSRARSNSVVIGSLGFRFSVWSSFQQAICHLKTWRPRWRSGAEKWECISAERSIFLVPNTSEPREVLAHIPMLGPVSEEFTLVASDAGLYSKKSSPWSEDIVLRLLKDVQLGPTGDEGVAAWLNGFLNHLHENGTLTPRVRDLASFLPLLPACVARTNATVRLSARDWLASVEADRLFGPDSQTEGWLGLLVADRFISNE